MPDRDPFTRAYTRAYAEHIDAIALRVIAQYRPALDALAHGDSCSDCHTYADIERHIAADRDPEPDSDLCGR